MRYFIFSLSTLLAGFAVGAATIVLDPGPGHPTYLGTSCGGVTVNEWATGFDKAGNAVTLVRATTHCNLSGRGGRVRHYQACWAVTFAKNGTLLRKTLIASNSGRRIISCAADIDATATYADAAAGNARATLSTVLVDGHGTVYRAVLLFNQSSN